MNGRRLNLVHQAFDKLDKTKDGVVTSDDLKGVYNGKKHPKYLSGQWTEDQVLGEWLNSFNGDDDDGQVCTLNMNPNLNSESVEPFLGLT